MCSSFRAKTPKSHLAAEQTLTGECWKTSEEKIKIKKISHMQRQRRSHRETVGGVCAHLTTQACPTLCDPMGYSLPGTSGESRGVSRQEYWSGAIISR